MSTSYKIVLTGIQFRQDRRQVRDALASLFKCEPDRIERLLGTAPVTIKSGITMEAAMKYQKAIQERGAEAMVQRDE
ncbi:hypothetical protein [Desulfomonile tiedjei]|uniref:Ribosomal protein L7/L12 n=1 Tax=Desulfomonile tiedjei (strain ATCC 49306 / DSM 6799 / DCB-1) TaxID=706587 RepID=I4CBL0_DESTA|nr:hypothetical protein [Desulfomonile tiedjei]AFM26951.1 hypothetical protein Desti_4317 [Desulfomonile tiedjei DSM 6799]